MAATFSPAGLEGLPEPVARYFRAALTPGQPLIREVRIEHAGEINLGKSDRWFRFRSREVVTMQPPGFVWDARIDMGLPGIVRVRDAYVAGEGILKATILGLVPIVDQRGSPELARGELLRFLAESVWYPTRLLPGMGVTWEPVDERSARATLRDAATVATMDFRFGPDDLVQSVWTDSRGRLVGKTSRRTPWEGTWTEYAERNGMRVPLAGEVAWILPEGRRPYWRGRVLDLRYE